MKIKNKWQVILLLPSVLIIYACGGAKVHLNDLQVIGSHNSYKTSIENPLLNYIFQIDSGTALSLQYEHIPILDQLNMGLRNLEMDVFYDPEGGYFSNPRGLDIIHDNGAIPLAFDPENKLAEPGLKMFHIQDIDFRSHNLLFMDGLKVLKKWSDENPNHTPIFVLINAKDQKVPATRDPLLFTKEALNTIDTEILSVFSSEDLITPGLVRGSSESLEKAVLTKGWPKLADVEGRFIFVLDEKEEKNKRYLEGHPGLKGRVLFVNSPEGNSEAAFRIINNPISDFDYIKDLVEKGYIVRTRADAATKESRTLDYTRFQKAKASGAQVISTDYYIPTSLYKSSFKVAFENDTYERIKAAERSYK